MDQMDPHKMNPKVCEPPCWEPNDRFDDQLPIMWENRPCRYLCTPKCPECYKPNPKYDPDYKEPECLLISRCKPKPQKPKNTTITPTNRLQSLFICTNKRTGGFGPVADIHGHTITTSCFNDAVLVPVVVGFYILFLAWHGIKFYVWKREKYNRKRTSLGGSNTSQGQSYEMDESLRTQTEDPTGQSVNQLGNVTAERGANRLQPTISLTLSQQISEIQATNPHSVPDRYRATRAADRREQHRKTSRLAEAISEGRGTQNQQNTATGAIQGTDPNQQEDTERTGFSAWIQKFYLIKFLIFVRNFANAHWKNELYLLIWVFTFLATLGEFIHLAVSRRGVGLLWLVWVVLCIAFVLRLTSGLMQRFRRYYAPACYMWLALCIIYIIRILTTVFEAGGQWNNWSGLFQDDGMKPGSHKVEDTVPWILFSIFMFIFLALAETQRCDEGKMDEDKEVDG